MITRDLHNILALMADFPAPWAVCGGWAIDLFLNRTTRPHKDVDLTILRADQGRLHDYLSGWTLEIAYDGKLEPWPSGHYIQLPRHIVWCRNSSYTPDFLEILFNEADEQLFYFRRNHTIQRARNKAFLITGDGVPILAPEIALLYKAKHFESADNQADFQNVLPHLDHEQRAWLRSALNQQHPHHPWLTVLEST